MGVRPMALSVQIVTAALKTVLVDGICGQARRRLMVYSGCVAWEGTVGFLHHHIEALGLQPQHKVFAMALGAAVMGEMVEHSLDYSFQHLAPSLRRAAIFGCACLVMTARHGAVRTAPNPGVCQQMTKIERKARDFNGPKIGNGIKLELPRQDFGLAA